MTTTAIKPDVRTTSTERKRPSAGPPVAYIVSRFPKPTETFVVNELLAVEKQGTPVVLFSLWRERPTLIHPDAKRVLARVRFAPFFSWPIARAHAQFLVRRPRGYFGALWTLIRATLGSPRYLLGGLAMFPKAVWFARQMSNESVAHIHAHFASHPAAAALVIHRLTGIPFSFTAHGSDLHRDRHMLREKVFEATQVIAIADYNRRVILEHCGEMAADKVKVIHCGVDPQVFRPRHGVSLEGLRGRPVRLACIGTLHAVKGQRYLLDAIRLLRQRKCKLICDFVGEGPDLPFLRLESKRLGIADAVRFRGPMTRDGVIDVLRAADLAVAPSVPTADGRREGIPVVLMEAMASGVAVVASDLSGIPELVVDGETGLLAPPGDSAALAAAIERLIRDSELRRQLAQAGREKVVRQFNLSKNAALLAELFQGRPRHD